MKKENILNDLSMAFSIKIINMINILRDKKEYIVSSQIGRSGTSIGANIREAEYAQSKLDFVSKLKIALKEANETSYWLELLLKTKYIDNEYYNELSEMCERLKILLIKSCNTASSKN